MDCHAAFGPCPSLTPPCACSLKNFSHESPRTTNHISAAISEHHHRSYSLHHSGCVYGCKCYVCIYLYDILFLLRLGVGAHSRVVIISSNSPAVLVAVGLVSMGWRGWFPKDQVVLLESPTLIHTSFLSMKSLRLLPLSAPVLDLVMACLFPDHAYLREHCITST